MVAKTGVDVLNIEITPTSRMRTNHSRRNFRVKISAAGGKWVMNSEKLSGEIPSIHRIQNGCTMHHASVRDFPCASNVAKVNIERFRAGLENTFEHGGAAVNSA